MNTRKKIINTSCCFKISSCLPANPYHRNEDFCKKHVACENYLKKMRAVYLREIFQSWDIFKIFTRTQELRLLCDADSCGIMQILLIIVSCLINRGVPQLTSCEIDLSLCSLSSLFQEVSKLAVLEKEKSFSRTFHGYRGTIWNKRKDLKKS